MHVSTLSGSWWLWRQPRRALQKSALLLHRSNRASWSFRWNSWIWMKLHENQIKIFNKILQNLNFIFLNVLLIFKFSAKNFSATRAHLNLLKNESFRAKAIYFSLCVKRVFRSDSWCENKHNWNVLSLHLSTTIHFGRSHQHEQIFTCKKLYPLEQH